MADLETLDADRDEFRCLTCGEVFILNIETGHVCPQEQAPE